ncbi:MAG: flavodoxin [Thalassospira sp.]|nr:flavodoxin [Thalassospira sp.]
MMNVLIINGHMLYVGWSTGSLNAHLVDVMSGEFTAQGHTVRHTVIDQGYDPETEVEKHDWADLIILQAPVNWFGAPWTHKKYLDEVFNAGLASQTFMVDDGRSRSDPSLQYGTGGKMQGKKFMISLTWNAPAVAFGNPDQCLYQGKDVDDAFVHIAACYRFCGVETVPSFSCHDVLKAPEIESDIKRLKAHLDTHLGLYAGSLSPAVPA